MPITHVNNLVEIFKLSANLSSTKRYSQIHLHVPESVLEHTGFVCLMSYLLVLEINSRQESEGHDQGPVPVISVLEKSLLHDIEEVVSGDVPRTTKYFNPQIRQEFESVEEHGIKHVLSNLGYSESSVIGEKVFLLWKTSKEDSSGLIVKVSDLLAVVYKVWWETIQMGNLNVLDNITTLREYILDVKGLVNEDPHLTPNSRSYIHDLLEDARDLVTVAQSLRA